MDHLQRFISIFSIVEEKFVLPILSTRCQNIIIKRTGRQETIPTIPLLFAALSLDKSPASKPTSAGRWSLTCKTSLPLPGLLFSLTTPFSSQGCCSGAEAPHNMAIKTWQCRVLGFFCFLRWQGQQIVAVLWMRSFIGGDCAQNAFSSRQRGEERVCEVTEWQGVFSGGGGG